MKKNINQILDNNNKIIFLLITLSFVVRAITLYFFHDDKMDNEWGVLLNNLIKFKTYAFFDYDNALIPSILVPPLYVYFLYFIKLITIEKINFLYSVIFFQIILSTISVYVFYKINKFFFSDITSLISSLVFSLFPLNIYAAGQVSSVTLQIFLSLLFLLFVFNLSANQTKNNFLIFSLISGLLILARGEFVIIYVITIFYFLLKKKIKLINFFIIILLSFLIVSPYMLRNYITFNQIVLVKSFGYNLWKGNNELSSVEGHAGIDGESFEQLRYELETLKKDKFYELKRDNVFLKEAKKNLNYDPVNYFNLFFKKMFAFFFVNLKSAYPNYYDFFHFIPSIIISALSFPGLILIIKKKEFKFQYLSLYLFTTIAIFSVFFILPRYKLTILPIQIILAFYFLVYVLNRIKKNAN